MIIPSISIRQDKAPGRKSTWGAFWREPRGTDGRENKRRKYFATEADAINFRDQFMAQLKRQPIVETPTIATVAGTIGEYLTDWLRVIKRKRDGATYKAYEAAVRIHLVPTLVDGVRFGDIKRSDLRRRHVKQLFAELSAMGLSYALRRHRFYVLSSGCGYAVSDEELDFNPCEKLARHLRDKGEQVTEPQPNPFTPEQTTAFFGYVEDHYPAWSEYFQFLHDTGVRVGEIGALTWPHVDIENRRAEIVASYSKVEKADKDPKTHQRRWIDLTSLVVDQLPKLRASQRQDLFRRGQSNPRQYVFTNTRGMPRRADAGMRKIFDKIIKRATIGTGKNKRPAFTDKRTPHNLRDTFATTHLNADFSRLPWVSKQLGHKSERMTIDHYFRFLPSSVTKGFADKIRQAR